MIKLEKFSKNQKIAIAAIVVPAALTLIGLIIAVVSLNKKVDTVVNLKPRFINVINNITAIKKEIANLHEMVEQQDELWVSETFRKNDLGSKIQIVNPPESDPREVASFLLIELKQEPLPHSVSVSTAYHTVAKSGILVSHNILRIPFLDPPAVLSKGTDFVDVTYVPKNKPGPLYTLKNFKYTYTDQNFHMEMLPLNVQPAVSSKTDS